jgi:hypothetical protein
VSATTLSYAQIEVLFGALDQELRAASVIGEVYVVGGAALCLALHARPSTRDVDAYFEPTRAIREAAARVAVSHEVPDGWLNDAVKGYLSPAGRYRPFLDLPNLKVLTAEPEYLLAMKCLAFRLGVEFHDEADIRFLLRVLGIERYDAAVEAITRYYPLERFPQKTLYALEEILDEHQ